MNIIIYDKIEESSRPSVAHPTVFISPLDGTRLQVLRHPSTDVLGKINRKGEKKNPLKITPTRHRARLSPVLMDARVYASLFVCNVQEFLSALPETIGKTINNNITRT